MSTYTGTTMSEYVDHRSDTDGYYTWDYSQGGDDTLLGGSGTDIFVFGNQLTALDTVDGGAGSDAIALAGNYFQTLVHTGGGTIANPTQLVLSSTTLTSIETILLDEGSGYGYNIKLDPETFAATGYGRIDATNLTSAPETIDGSAVSQPLTLIGGRGNIDLIGGSGNDLLNLDQSYVTGDSVDGGGGDDTVQLTLINGGTTLSLPDSGLQNIGTISLDGTATYHVTVGNADVAAGHVQRITASNELDLDASAVMAGSINASGFSTSVLTGGGGDDSLSSFAILSGSTSDMGSLTGNDGNDVLYSFTRGQETISGGNGNDTITCNALRPYVSGDAGDDSIIAYFNAAQEVGLVDGGSGNDTVEIVFANQSDTINASALRNIEALVLSSAVTSGPTSIVWQNGIIQPQQALAVSAHIHNGQINFDGSAEQLGSFVFTLPGAASDAGNGDQWNGGSGNDVFMASNPSALTGLGNVWNGNGGVNTLDYSGTTDGMTIDDVTGMARGTGSIADTFSNFQIFKFGAGPSAFTGGGSAETVDMTAAGTSTVAAGAGNDVIYLGGTLDAADSIDGGADSDTVVLDGDYSAGLTLGSLTLANVETLRLQHLSGEPVYSYRLTENNGNVTAGATLMIDGSQLPGGDALSFNGAAETDGHFNMMGGAGNDTLTGGALADTLGGGAGADSLTGGAGNDSYIVASSTDQVIETVNGGTDTVFTLASYTLGTGQSVEWLTTTSQSGTTALGLTGNNLSQTIDGNAGADRLDGYGGGDTLIGHAGNDTYIVRSVTDQVVEANGEGSDMIYAAVSYTLASGQSIDTLATTVQSGTTAINLTGNNNANHVFGNNGDNLISGSGGADLLFGYSGNDTIIGGAGADVIDTGNGRDVVRFTTVSDSTSTTHDVVMNMNLNATDKVDFPVIPTSIHAEIVGGTMNSTSFDTNLATAIHDAGQMGANQAVLFAPDAGDLAGHLFLIVDSNHTAGYQAGADYVVELVNPAGTLTLDDFI